MTIAVIDSHSVDLDKHHPHTMQTDPYLVLIDQEHYAKVWCREPNDYRESFWCIKVFGKEFDDDWLETEYGEDWSGYVGLTDDSLDTTLEKIERICRVRHLL